jgi:oligopeptide transport system substrate-binding protein
VTSPASPRASASTASWKIGDRTRLVKNPRFYDAKNVCLDEVYLYPTADSISAERRVRAGQLDANVDIQSNRIAYLRQPGQIPEYVRTNPWLGTVYLAFNQKLPKFKDRRVRQALAMSIDREFITKKLLRGSQPPAYGLVTPGVAGYGDGVKAYWADWPLERRQAEARRLLAAAGYGPTNPLKTAIKIRNISDPILIMPAIQADWRAVGVEVALEPEESQIAYADFRARNFEIADASWIADFDDPLTYLALLQTKTGVQNYGDYSNPAYDALIDRSEHEPDPARRIAILKRAERLMLDDAAIATVYFYISKNLVSPQVTGWLENVPDHHRRRWVCFKDPEARRAANKGTR